MSTSNGQCASIKEPETSTITFLPALPKSHGKSQPWKSEWPPQESQAKPVVESKGELLLLDGTGGSGTPAVPNAVNLPPKSTKPLFVIVTFDALDLAMDVVTEIYYLRQDGLYASEKPYTMRYAPREQMKPTNVVREKQGVTVRDLRGIEDQFNLDRNGFMVKILRSEMTYEDYHDPAKITDIYLPELEGVLNELFPGSYVDFVSYLIRKRDVGFPYASGESYRFGQPNIVAHIDATPEDLARQIQQRYRDNAAPILQKRYRYITLWKPLKGPLYDWPLALCESSSVNVDRDLEAQDIVGQEDVLENYHVYHRSEHQWYYLSGHQDSELFIFRQADSQPGRNGTPHCAFQNPSAPPGCCPRESIEVVAFVYGSS